MPEINWSPPPPYEVMMDATGYTQYNPAGTGPMMGAASVPQTMSYYNEAIIPRRHEIMHTQPTNSVHDQIRKMRCDGRLTRVEFENLMNETPENRMARNTLLKQLNNEHRINTALFDDMYYFS